MGKKTSCNRSRPVFFGFSIFQQTSQLATKKFQNLCNCNWWSGLLQLGSVWFQSFFQSSELDLRTLVSVDIMGHCHQTLRHVHKLMCHIITVHWAGRGSFGCCGCWQWTWHCFVMLVSSVCAMVVVGGWMLVVEGSGCQWRWGDGMLAWSVVDVDFGVVMPL